MPSSYFTFFNFEKNITICISVERVTSFTNASRYVAIIDGDASLL